MKYLIQFDDKWALDPGVVGRKFASLARAARAGFEVPQGAAVSTAAHRFFLAHRCWPESLFDEVLRFAHGLGFSKGLSIRSSAIREDLENQSFAGQYETFLRVSDPHDLRDKIEKCWLSAESETVRSYLKADRSTDWSTEVPLMAVVVQRMVDAAAAGVAFGRNPLNPARDEIVIEAVSGCGEHLVNGHVSPYRAFVGGRGELRVEPPPQSAEPVDGNNGLPLGEEDWRTIADRLRQLEAVCGEKPLDMEWVVDDRGAFWLLQFRRITTVEEDDLRAPPGTWTRRIADDLWADRLTPFLTHAMVLNAPRFTLSRISKILGIPVVEPTVTVINGYLYVNCEGIRRAVAFLPRRFRTADLKALVPEAAGFDLDALPQPGLVTLIATGLRGLLLLFLEPALNPLVCLWLTRRRHWRHVEKRIERFGRLPDASPADAWGKVLFALDTLASIQVWNQWPYFFATFFTWLLRWLIVDRSGASHATFLTLIGSGARNVSIDIERRVRQLARRILVDRALTELFRTSGPNEIFNLLPRSFESDLKQFLDRYGCRSRHRTLYIKRWAEAPEEVIGILQSLVRDAGTTVENGDDGSRSISGMSPYDDRPQSGSLPTATSPDWLRHLLQKPVLSLARKFLDLREDLRFLLDKALYQIRQSLLALGERTGLGENVLFLNIDELAGLVDGSLDPAQVRATAEQRHHRFGETVTAATFFIDGRPAEGFPIENGTALKGIGTSPGRVTGRARIVADPSRAVIQKGDILIAENTDPGWTPILSLAGGMVMEEGGLLNHCSIVARELKIPAIVGVQRATQRIKDGERLTIDGGLGLIRLEGV